MTPREEYRRAISASRDEGKRVNSVDYATSPQGHIYGATVSVFFPDWDEWKLGRVPKFYVELSDETYQALQNENDPSWYDTRILSDAGRPVATALRWLDHQWHYNRYAEVWQRSAVPKATSKQLDREITKVIGRSPK